MRGVEAAVLVRLDHRQLVAAVAEPRPQPVPVAPVDPDQLDVPDQRLAHDGGRRGTSARCAPRTAARANCDRGGSGCGSKARMFEPAQAAPRQLLGRQRLRIQRHLVEAAEDVDGLREHRRRVDEAGIEIGRTGGGSGIGIGRRMASSNSSRRRRTRWSGSWAMIHGKPVDLADVDARVAHRFLVGHAAERLHLDHAAAHAALAPEPVRPEHARGPGSSSKTSTVALEAPHGLVGVAAGHGLEGRLVVLSRPAAPARRTGGRVSAAAASSSSVASPLRTAPRREQLALARRRRTAPR